MSNGAMRLLLGLFVGILPVAACHCSPDSYGPPCALVAHRDIIFLGKVVFSDDDGSGTFLQATLIRFEVHEVFKGLPAKTKEVWIDPGSYTSCYATYEVNQQYLVFASDYSKRFESISAMTVAARRSRKPLPAGIDPSNPPRIYLSAICHGSRAARNAAEDVAWLRQWSRGKTTTRIYGRVLEHYSMFFLPPRQELPLPGAKIQIQGAGKTYVAVSGGSGQYSFDHVAPGRYKFTVTLDKYHFPHQGLAVDVARGACAEINPGLFTTGQLAGLAVGPDGTPVSGVRLQLGRLHSSGKLELQPHLHVRTNSNGQFRMDELPSGDFLLGVNLDQRPPTRETPYPPVYFPGTRVRNAAVLLHLAPAGKLFDLKLRLPEPFRKRRVTLLVRFPNGAPAPGLMVYMKINGNLADSALTDYRGQAELPCLAGLRYRIHASYPVEGYSARQRTRIVLEGSAVLAAGTKPARLMIVLNRKRVFRRTTELPKNGSWSGGGRTRALTPARSLRVLATRQLGSSSR